jgi:hypothetical protein
MVQNSTLSQWYWIIMKWMYVKRNQTLPWIWSVHQPAHWLGVKGTVARDFLLLVFFMNWPQIGPWFTP